MSTKSNWKILQIIPANGYKAEIQDGDEIIIVDLVCWALVEGELSGELVQRIEGMKDDNRGVIGFCNQWMRTDEAKWFLRRYLAPEKALDKDV